MFFSYRKKGAKLCPEERKRKRRKRDEREDIGQDT